MKSNKAAAPNAAYSAFETLERPTFRVELNERYGIELNATMMRAITREASEFILSEDEARDRKKTLAAKNRLLSRLDALLSEVVCLRKGSTQDAAVVLLYGRLMSATEPFNREDEVRYLKLFFGGEPGFFEKQLINLREVIASHSKRSKGRPMVLRNNLIAVCAIAFEEAGGTVSAPFRHDLGKIESPFISFVRDIIKSCEPKENSTLGRGVAENIRSFLREQRRNPLDPADASDRSILRRRERIRTAFRNDEFPTTQHEHAYEMENLRAAPTKLVVKNLRARGGGKARDER